MTASPAMNLAPVGIEARVRPNMEVGRPIRAAVLSNPNGGFNRRRDHIDEVRREMAKFDAEHVEVSEPEDIHRAVRRLDAAGVELLIVNGGDGTLQMVLTALFAETRSDRPPLLALVPGGTSNTINGNAGWSKDPITGIRDALAGARQGRIEGHILQKPVLQVESSLWDRPKCAMQFSAGAIYNAIRFAKRQVENRGGYGPAGPVLTMIWFIVTILSGTSRDIFPPLHLRGSIDGKAVKSDPLLAILVSTLDHLFLGIRPFWGRGPGRIQYSALAYRPRRFILSLSSILRGRQGRFNTERNGYTSIHAYLIDLEIDGGFMLDGELFHTPDKVQIRLSAATSANFLRPGPG